MRAWRIAVLGFPLLGIGACDDVLGLEPLTGIDASVERDATSETTDDAEGASDAGAGGEGDACVRWVPATQGAVPEGAFGSSVPGSTVTLYVCRVVDAGLGLGTVPGKLRPGYYCYFGDVGEAEQHYSDYEVLVSSSCTLAWEPAPMGVTPKGGIATGSSEDGGDLFSCRLDDDGGAMPGEIGYEGWSTGHNCIYSYADASYSTATSFDILAQP
jgi:hypothetical protein